MPGGHVHGSLQMRPEKMIVVVLVLLVLGVAGLGGCSSTGEEPDDTTTVVSGETSVSSEAPTSSQVTPSSDSHGSHGAETLEIGEVAKVEQGSLSVSTITVTGDLASEEAETLLLTGDAGEEKNDSRAPAAGKEFLMITFVYEKAEWFEFRGGIYPEDLILRDSAGTEYLPVETNGHGGIHDTNAGDVGPGVKARTTAVFEVPAGETGLVLVYHTHHPDMFYVNIR